MSYQAPPPQQPYGQPMAAAKPQKTVVSILAAIYQIILAIFSICGGVGVVFLGGAVAAVGGELSSIAAQSGDAQAASQIAAVTAGGGGLTVIIGVLTLVLGIATLVVAIGIFIDKPWAYIGTIAVLGIYIALQVLSLLTTGFDIGANIVGIILAILAGIIIFLFVTDENVKRQFGRA